MRRWSITPLLAVIAMGAVTPASADWYLQPLLVAQRTWRADVVVLGAVVDEPARDRATLLVSEVLKGSADRLLELTWADPSSQCFPAADQAVGIFFLTRTTSPAVMDPGCDEPAPALWMHRVCELVAMQRDPGPAVRAPSGSSDADLINWVGRVFGQVSLRCPEAPWVEVPSDPEDDPLSFPGAGYEQYQKWPWSESGRRRYAFEILPGTKLQCGCVGPCTAVGEILRSDVESMLRYGPKRQWPRRLHVRVDFDGPTRVGTLERDEARRFLHERLSSGDRVVTAALIALARMRDATAVPRALDLLRHPSPLVRMQSAGLLAAARAEAAVGPLCAALDSQPPLGLAAEADDGDAKREAQKERGTFIQALRVIGDRRAVPTLLRAVHRRDGWSGDAAGQLCTLECVPTLLQDLRLAVLVADAGQPHYALRRLVARSNNADKVESWMNSAGRPNEREHARKWREWWDRHGPATQLVR
jgi:hypothetical protein